MEIEKQNKKGHKNSFYHLKLFKIHIYIYKRVFLEKTNF